MRILEIISFVLMTGLSSTALSQSTNAPINTNLTKLYQRFEKSNFSTMSMPELNKQVLVSGVVVENSKGFSGTILHAAAPSNPGKIVARLTASDDSEEAIMEALSIHSNFKAVCTLAFSSGTDYLALQDCVFKAGGR